MTARHIHRRLRVLGGAFAAAAQFIIAGAAFAEGKPGHDAVAHVEEAGTSLHHAHNEAKCIACVSQHLLSGAELCRSTTLAITAELTLPPTLMRDADSRVPQFFTRPRAPPAFPV